MKNVTSLLTDLFVSFVLEQVVLAGNDLDGAGGGSVATVGSGDDGVSIVDAATAEVESTGGLEGNLKRSKSVKNTVPKNGQFY